MITSLMFSFAINYHTRLFLGHCSLSYYGFTYIEPPPSSLQITNLEHNALSEPAEM